MAISVSAAAVTPFLWSHSDTSCGSGRSSRWSRARQPLTSITTPLRPSSSSVHLGDDIVGVPAQAGDLVGEWLTVRAGLVRPAENDDRIGHSLILQTAPPIHAVGVHRDHVYLERPAGGAVGLAQTGEPGEQAGQVRRIPPAVQPAVPDLGGAAERGVSMAADED